MLTTEIEEIDRASLEVPSQVVLVREDRMRVVDHRPVDRGDERPGLFEALAHGGDPVRATAGVDPECRGGALVVDVGGNFGFIASMQYVPALVVAAVMLLGPLTSCLEGIAVGVDVLPGPWTLSGAALITFGSGLIAFTSRETSATVEISRG